MANQLLLLTKTTIMNQYVILGPNSGLPSTIEFYVTVNNTSTQSGVFSIYQGNPLIKNSAIPIYSNISLPANGSVSSNPFTIGPGNGLLIFSTVGNCSVNLYTNNIPITQSSATLINQNSNVYADIYNSPIDTVNQTTQNVATVTKQSSTNMTQIQSLNNEVSALQSEVSTLETDIANIGTAGSSTSTSTQPTTTNVNNVTQIIATTNIYSNISALRSSHTQANSPQFSAIVFTEGYYTPGDMGDSKYYYNSGDTTSPDNGSTIIVDSSGNRWYLEHSNSIRVEQFGAYGNLTNADTASFNALGAYLVQTSNASSGKIIINKQYLIDGDLNLPAGVGIKGTYDDTFSISGTATFNFMDWNSLIVLNSNYSILGNAGSGLEGLIVYAQGFVSGYSTQQAYNGTAFQVGDPATNNGGANPYVRNCSIMGFNIAVATYGSGRTYIDNLLHECNYGVWLQASFDISRINKVEGWPFCWNQSGSSIDITYKTGSNVHIEGGNSSWHKVMNCFSWNWAIGCSENNSGNNSYFLCGADGNVSNTAQSKIAFYRSGQSYGAAQYIGCQGTVGIIYYIAVISTGGNNAIEAQITSSQVWGIGQVFQLSPQSNSQFIVEVFNLNVQPGTQTFGNLQGGASVYIYGGNVPTPANNQAGSFYIFNSTINNPAPSIETNDPNGSIIGLTHIPNGQVGTNIWVRNLNGDLQVVNSAFTNTIMQLDQNGNLSINGVLTQNAGL